MSADTETDVAQRLAALSTREIVDALGLGRRASLLESFVTLAVRGASGRLGEKLARFDRRVGVAGVAVAAPETLATFGARVNVRGATPRGPILLVANHPGAFDALALLATSRRRDAYVLAADRPFLRAMPHLAEHLIFIPEANAFGRLSALRRATDVLRSGSLLLHFGAGAIEPDTRFPNGASLSASWPPGTGALAFAAARQGASVIPAFVAGVHSPRAKKLAIVRLAERRGVTTIAPLLQATLPGFRDVVVSVNLGSPLPNRVLMEAANDIERTSMVRSAVAALGQSLRARSNAAIESDHLGREFAARVAASVIRVLND